MREIGTIESMLQHGSDKAIKSDLLMLRTGRTKRDVQAMIATERENGALICACDRGYYLASNRKEAAEYYRHGTAAAKKLLHTLRHIKKYADEIEGQEGLYEQREPDLLS